MTLPTWPIWSLHQPADGVDGQYWSGLWYFERAFPEFAKLYVAEVRDALDELWRTEGVWRTWLQPEECPDYDAMEPPLGERAREHQLSRGARTPADTALHVYGSREQNNFSPCPHRVLWVSPGDAAYELFGRLMQECRRCASVHRETPLMRKLDRIPDPHERARVAVAISECRRRPKGLLRDRALGLTRKTGLYRSRRTPRIPFTDLSGRVLTNIVGEAENVVESVWRKGRGTDIGNISTARMRMIRCGDSDRTEGGNPVMPDARLAEEFWFLLPAELQYVLEPRVAGRAPTYFPAPSERRAARIVGRDLTMMRLQHDPKIDTTRATFRQALRRP